MESAFNLQSFGSASVGGLISLVIIASSHMLSVLSDKQQAPVQVESYSPRRHIVSAAEGPPAAYQRYACGQTSVSSATSKDIIPVNHVTRSLLIASLLPKDFTGFGFVKPSGACRKAKESLHALHKAGSNQHW